MNLLIGRIDALIADLRKHRKAAKAESELKETREAEQQPKEPPKPLTHEQFREMVSEYRTVLDRELPIRAVHVCGTPEACKRKALEVVARQVAIAEHFAANIDLFYVSDKG